MSVIDAASFGYTDSVSVWGNGASNGGGYTISTAIVRGSSHTRSYRAASTSATWRYRTLAPAGQTFLVFGVAFYIASTGPVFPTAVIQVTNQAGTVRFQLYLPLNSTAVTMQVNGVDVGTPLTLATGTWYYALIQVALDASARIRASINGAEIADVTQNTSALGTSFGEVGLGIEFGGGGTGKTLHFSDYVLCNAGTDYLTLQNAGADVWCDERFPSSDGNTLQWTPNAGVVHYTQIDEVPPDDDAAYLTDGGAGTVDLWGFAPLSTSPARTVLGTVFTTYAKRTGGAPTFSPVYHFGANDFPGTAVAPGAAYGYASEVRTTSPLSGEAWKVSQINSMQLGAIGTTAAVNVRLSQVCFEIVHIPEVLPARAPDIRRSGMAGKLQRSDYSRMWILEGTAGPATVPQYESYWKAGAAAWPLGDVTNVYVPSPDRYGAFDIAGKIIGEPGNPTLPVTAKYFADAASLLLRLAELGCDSDLHVHMGLCKDPRDFNAGWDKIVILENARPTQWGTTELGALMPGERSTVNEEVPFTGTRIYEVMPIAMQEQAAAQVVQEVIAIIVCDAAACADCGVPSDGCQVVFALTLTAGGSPGLPAEVLFTINGGQTWDDTNVSTLGAAEDPNDLSCVGTNMVVVSEDSESLHYAAIADILSGTETWTEVTTGFVATKGPLKILSLDPAHTWIVAEGGYVYFTDDPTAGVEVQDAGVVTTQNLLDIHGIDINHLVAVGASNAVIVTANGGETWAAVTGPAVGINLNAVWLRSETEWFVGTAGGRLYYTQDGGDTWTQKAFPGSGAGVVRDIRFVTQNVGYMSHDTATPAGRILRTINGGNSWYVAPEGNLSIPTNDRIDMLATCDDPNVIFGAGLAGNAVDGFIVKGA